MEQGKGGTPLNFGESRDEVRKDYRLDFPPNLHVGTSSWSSKDWYDIFYPRSIRPEEFIAYYARHFDTVEIDSTWHHMPSANMVEAWDSRTPEGFVFAAKVPKIITHEKYLVDCQAEMNQFLRTMERLGSKLGPLLFQFPYFAKGKDAHEYETGEDFIRRLEPFLDELPSGFRYVVEIRNPHWINPRLLDRLRKQKTALALISYYTMPSLDKLMPRMDVNTTDFAYIRFLGHHNQMESLIEKLVREGKKAEGTWDELLVDRSKEMRQWTPAIAELVAKNIPVYVYFNNHYAGFALGSIKLFAEVWRQHSPT